MRTSKSALCLSLASLALSNCAELDYSEVSENGKFSGKLFVMWVGEGSSYLGDGSFVFVPNPEDPLTFTRIDDNGEVIGDPISPEIMYTDGGSIPRIASAFNGFSPWGYAPAYMIHDWLFIAHHCNVDGTPTEQERKHAELDFRDSALIIAESIKALQVAGKVDKNDVAGGTISYTVAGPISRRLWNRSGACADHRVSEADKLAALAAFPPAVQATAEDFGIVLEPGMGLDEPIQKALLVGEFGF